MTVIYIDSLFALNLIINGLLLLTTAKIVGVPAHRARVALGALAGALYAVAVWLPGLSLLGAWPFKILSALGIVAIVFAGPRGAYFIRLSLVFGAVSFALGGIVYAIGLLTQSATKTFIPYFPIDAKALLLTSALSYMLLSLVFRRAGRHVARETTPVIIHVGLRKVQLIALMDSGHTLTDPMTGAPVLVVDHELAPRLLGYPLSEQTLSSPAEALGTLPVQPARFRLIPYRAVGVSCGFLLAFKPDCLYIHGRQQKNTLVAFSPTPVSDGTGHHALAGGLVL